MPRMNSLKLFISHSFDHPDKFVRIREFLADHGIRHVDWSIPVWDLLNGPGVQAEIERRIRRCDRVIVIITREMHFSPWINLELTWARRYGKPVVGVYEHGQAGAPIPAALAAADPSLIGWRATSLAKAITDEDVTLIRAVDIAEDADRDRLITTAIAACGGLSLLMVGADVANLRRLRADMERRGVIVNAQPTRVVAPAVKGVAIGAVLGYVLGLVFGRTSTAARNFAIAGSFAGGAYNVHRFLQAEVKQLQGLLSEFVVAPVKALPSVSRIAG